MDLIVSFESGIGSKKFSPKFALIAVKKLADLSDTMDIANQ